MSEINKKLTPEEQKQYEYLQAKAESAERSAAIESKSILETGNILPTKPTEKNQLSSLATIEHPDNQPIGSVGNDNQEPLKPGLNQNIKPEDNTTFFIKNLNEVELLDRSNTPKIDLQAFLNDIQERVSNPNSKDLDPHNRQN